MPEVRMDQYNTQKQQNPSKFNILGSQVGGHEYPSVDLSCRSHQLLKEKETCQSHLININSGSA